MDKIIEEIKKEYEISGENVVSNFDHVIDENIVEKMKTDKKVYGYPAWDFYGSVWYKDGKYHCAVMQYHSLSEIVSGGTFQEVKDSVCKKYGND